MLLSIFFVYCLFIYLLKTQTIGRHEMFFFFRAQAEGIYPDQTHIQSIAYENLVLHSIDFPGRCQALSGVVVTINNGISRIIWNVSNETRLHIMERIKRKPI